MASGQGRGEQGTEAYARRYIEVVSETRTKPEAIFSARHGLSKVQRIPSNSKCWFGVRLITPGWSSPRLKNPPPAPVDSSHRCSSRKIVLVHL